MKRIIAFLLCMLTVMSLNLTVFAASDTSVLEELETPVSQEISAKYNSPEYERVYCVNVEWKDFNVSYKEIKSDWNLDTLQYDTDEIVWTGNPNVKITNKSSVGVYVDLLYFAPEFDDISVNWKINSFGAGVDSGSFDERETGHTESITFWMASKGEEGYENGDVPYAEFTGTLKGDLTAALYNRSEGYIDTDNIPLGTVRVTIF